MTGPLSCIVVTDANVLINLIHVGRMGLCGQLAGYEFVVPDHVREEITDANQRTALDEAISNGVFRVEAIVDPNSIELFGQLGLRLGRGESACLTLAIERCWLVASDEKKRFRREAESRIGKDRIIGTPDLFVLAIQAGLLTVEEANADKITLEGHHFSMPVESFQDLLG